MASYTKTTWVNGTTPANATNMNKIEDALEELFNMIYPVGSIYMSVNSANPSTLFGGTWVAWGEGKVPVGIDTNDTDFDTVEETGGAKTVTLTESQIPSHRHYGFSQADAPYVRGSGDTNGLIIGTSYGNGFNTSNDRTGETGGGQAHSNLQPYITCYMWKRTA